MTSDKVHGQHLKRPLSPYSFIDPAGLEVLPTNLHQEESDVTGNGVDKGNMAEKE